MLARNPPGDMCILDFPDGRGCGYLRSGSDARRWPAGSGGADSKTTGHIRLSIWGENPRLERLSEAQVTYFRK